MVCYETHFGQKIAGAFWFLGGQQSQRERGVGCEVAAQTAALVSDLGSILNSTPQHTRVASVSLSVKWVQNNLLQPSAGLWYHPRNYGEAENGAHTRTDKTEEQAQLCLLGGSQEPQR